VPAVEEPKPAIESVINQVNNCKPSTERLKYRKLFSGVGTPDYLAPEILLGIGHSK
jgi:serine/threonine protein kinase